MKYNDSYLLDIDLKLQDILYSSTFITRKANRASRLALSFENNGGTKEDLSMIEENLGIIERHLLRNLQAVKDCKSSLQLLKEENCFMDK